MVCYRWIVMGVAFVTLGSPSLQSTGFRATAGDWPGWRGADRTGVSSETGLLKEWPSGGPALLWKATDLGEGYSTPSVVAGRVYLMGAKEGQEYTFALNARDGKPLWTTKIGPMAKGEKPVYPGPRCTPTVDGERIYSLGSDGDLVCLDLAGRIVWHKHMDRDLEGNRGKWCYTESPLIDGDLLICTPGGAKTSMAAVRKMTGEVVWKAEVPGAGEAAYASAIVAEAGGVKQYVQFLRNAIVSVAAKDGALLWQYRKNAGMTNCSTPIFHDGCVFHSASGPMSGGTALLRLSAEGAKVSASEVYFNKNLNNHHGGIVRVGDSLFGTTGTSLVCLDFKSGEIKWQDRCVGKGSISAADGCLYVRGENDGQVALVEASPAGYKERGRLTQGERSKFKAWAHPVISGGCLYLSDSGVLLCYDIKGK